MTRRSGSIRVLAAAAAAVWLTLVAPATSAAPDEHGEADRAVVLLSADGETWSESLTTPLLDDIRRWVPGDVGRTSLLIRHTAEGGARGRVAVGVDGDAELVEAIDLRVRIDGAPWSEDPSTPVSIAEDEVLPLDIEAAFAEGAGNLTQRSTAWLVVSVGLSASDVGDPPGRQSDAAVLPRTGSGVAALLAVAGALILVGFGVRAAVRGSAHG